MDVIKDKPNILYLVMIRRSSLFSKCPVKKMHTNVLRKKMFRDLRLRFDHVQQCKCGKELLCALVCIYDIENNKPTIHGDDNRPAVEFCCNNCGSIKQVWYTFNKIHREDGPASINKSFNDPCDCDNSASVELTWVKNGLTHNDNGPAYFYGHVVNDVRCTKHFSLYNWYKDGKLHNENGPAEIETEPGMGVIKKWYLDGKLSRVNDKPCVKQSLFNSAIIVKQWYKNDLLHREAGPAVITINNASEHSIHEWYVDGKKHRIGGPAVYTFDHNNDGNIKYYDEEWWINGEQECF